MSDAPSTPWPGPVSWPSEPVVGRDGEPIVKRDGEPVALSVPPLPDLPPSYSVPGLSFHYEPHFDNASDPRLGEVLARLAEFRRDVFGNLTILRDEGASNRAFAAAKFNALFAIADKALAGALAFEKPLTDAFTTIATLEDKTMAAFADLKSQLDALEANVGRVATLAQEQKAAIEEMAALRDNGTEEEFAASVERVRGLNERLAAVGAAPMAPAPSEPAPPVDAAPAEPAPAEPVAGQPAPDTPPADPAVPVEPGSPDNPAT